MAKEKPAPAEKPAERTKLAVAIENQVQAKEALKRANESGTGPERQAARLEVEVADLTVEAEECEEAAAKAKARAEEVREKLKDLKAKKD